MMPASFFDQPILNSPYKPPTRHHALDQEGQPFDLPPVEGRRRSHLLTPVPKARKKQGKSKQASFVMEDAQGLSTAEQEYNDNPVGSGAGGGLDEQALAADPPQRIDLEGMVLLIRRDPGIADLHGRFPKPTVCKTMAGCSM
jgi:hypothetical protein